MITNFKGRLARLEDRHTPRAEVKSIDFTEEKVAAVKAACLAFKKHFGDYVSITYRSDEPKTSDIRKLGEFWLKNLATLLPCPDGSFGGGRHWSEIKEMAMKIPELEGYCKLVDQLWGS